MLNLVDYDSTMASDRFAPGKQKILDTLGEAEQRPNARQGLTFGDLLERTGLDRSILSKYLKDLQDGDLIERTTDRTYLIVDQGREALNRRDDIQVISRSKKIQREEIVPDGRVSVPQILPIDASVYATPEIESQRTSHHADEKQARHSVLADITTPIIKRLEDMFVDRFRTLAGDWEDYRIQQMQSAERKRYLRKLYRWNLPESLGREAVNRTLKQIEANHMGRKFPEGTPPRPLTFDTILDFEAVVLVRVSREKLAKNRERIRNRMAAYLLKSCRGYEWPLDVVYVNAMVASGILTADEFREFRRTKGKKKKRLQIPQELLVGMSPDVAKILQKKLGARIVPAVEEVQ